MRKSQIWKKSPSCFDVYLVNQLICQNKREIFQIFVAFLEKLIFNLIVVCLFQEFYYAHIFSHPTQLFNFSHYLQTAAKVHSLLEQYLVLFIFFIIFGLQPPNKCPYIKFRSYSLNHFALFIHVDQDTSISDHNIQIHKCFE